MGYRDGSPGSEPDRLREAEDAGYEVFLTTDQGIPYLQNPARRKIPVLVIRSRTNQIEDLLKMVAAIQIKLANIQPGQIAFTSGPL